MGRTVHGDSTHALPAPSGGAAAAPPAADEVWRLFVALEITEELRAQLRHLQDQLRRTGVRVGWTAPENLHLTLLFVGDFFAGRVPPLAAALDEAARGVPPFAFDVATLGFFGSPRSPRVLWAGVPAPPPELRALQARAAAAAVSCGVLLEKRPFSAHLTLGRVRPAGRAGARAADHSPHGGRECPRSSGCTAPAVLSERFPGTAGATSPLRRPDANAGAAATLTSALESLNNTFGGRVPVSRALLMRSVLGPAGQKYTVIHESKLTGD